MINCEDYLSANKKCDPGLFLGVALGYQWNCRAVIEQVSQPGLYCSFLLFDVTPILAGLHGFCQH